MIDGGIRHERPGKRKNIVPIGENEFKTIFGYIRKEKLMYENQERRDLMFCLPH